jgi:tRNA pseudouridine38-40 synthase
MSVAYDGSGYAGWQVQPNGVTVQEKIESALSTLTGQTVKVHGSGRTDQGVHGREQVVHFDLTMSLVAPSFLRSMNAILPPDIRVWAVRRARPDFHARRSARCKEYRYFIWDGAILPPFLRHYRAHVRTRLDHKAMAEAARLLVGQHDFAAFTANPNRQVDSTVRTLQTLEVRRRGSEVVIVARADGFLYKMVRSLAGFLIRVGEGAALPQDATRILASGERTARVPTAPPEGLFLWRVQY